jgi:sugar phosphate isomerase/epimerase
MNLPKLSWRISPQLYAWRKGGAEEAPSGLPQYLEEAFSHAAAGGYQGVEFGLSILNSNTRTRIIMDRLRERNLELAALFATLREGSGEKAIAEIAKLAEHAAGTGCTLLNVATLPPPGSPAAASGSVGGHRGTLEILEELGKALEGTSLRVCWHPHEEHLRNGAAGLREFTDNAGPALAVCLDVGWVLRANEVPENVLINDLGRIRMLHLRDMSQGRWRQALGEGDLNLRAVLAASSRLPHLHWASVEIWIERNTEVTRELAENALVSSEYYLRCARELGTVQWAVSTP